MRVKLGSIEVTEEERRAIKLALGFKSGKASRHETRVFALSTIEKAVKSASMPDPEVAIQAAEREEQG